MTSVTVRPETPSSSSASWTGWSRSGLMIASIFFISVLLSARPPGHADRHGSWPRSLRRRCRRVVLGARHRHELLRVAPHAVLDDVEAVTLLLRLDPQPVGRLDDEEDDERDPEHRGEGGHHAQRLDP